MGTGKQVQSKSWSWQTVDATWTTVADEFLPVALRWRERGCKRVLDLGCGVGRHALYLADQGLDVVAADLSAEGLAQVEASAQERGLASRVQTLRADMVAMPDDLQPFDAIVAFHAIYHTDYPGMQRILQWMARSLRPGGGIYLTLKSKHNPDWSDPSHERINDYTSVPSAGIEAGIPHTYLARDDVMQLLEGFAIARLHHTEHIRNNGRSSVHFYVEAYLDDNKD